MRLSKVLTFSVFLLLIIGFNLFALETPYDNSSSTNSTNNDISLGFYYTPGKKGWWWYEIIEKKEEPKKEVIKDVKKVEKKKEIPVVQKEEFVVKPLEEYSYEELLYMPVEKFRKVYEHYLNLAVGFPTEENIYKFYNVLDVMRKKALLFASVANYVIQKHPELSTARDIPTVGSGIEAVEAMKGEEFKNYLFRDTSSFGYIVFVKEGCNYCEVQKKIMRIAVLDGIEVKYVDIDQQPEVVNVFEIDLVPTVIVVDRITGKHMPVASGVTGISDIYKRTYSALKILRGEFSPGQTHLYEFQKGSSLDPFEPPPLWKHKK